MITLEIKITPNVRLVIEYDPKTYDEAQQQWEHIAYMIDQYGDPENAFNRRFVH